MHPLLKNESQLKSIFDQVIRLYTCWPIENIASLVDICRIAYNYKMNNCSNIQLTNSNAKGNAKLTKERAGD
jgi:hypothetical protein